MPQGTLPLTVRAPLLLLPTAQGEVHAEDVEGKDWTGLRLMLGNRNLRFLVLGQFISAIGDQFYLIAMPWLALELTGSGLVAGTVLAVASLPRALFMLIGGSLTDRFDARTLLIASNGLQGVLMGILAAVVLRGFTPMWILYLMGFLTGLVDAFGIPAFNSILPQLVPDPELERGNAVLQGANMASGAVGPALAGALIAAASGPNNQAALAGIGVAFLVDAVTYWIGISFFFGMPAGAAARKTLDQHESLIGSLGGLRDYVRSNPQLRTLLGLMMILGLFLTGTIRVGFPLLAERQYAGGAQTFGWLSSSFGLGLLVGLAVAGSGTRLRPKGAGRWILGLAAILPAGLILLGTNRPLSQSLLVIFAMGSAFGYVMIFLLSWLQRHTPTDMIGRVMAVAMFATVGLSPVSQALMGVILDANLQLTLIAVGTLIMLILALAAADRRLWDLGAPERSMGA